MNTEIFKVIEQNQYFLKTLVNLIGFEEISQIFQNKPLLVICPFYTLFSITLYQL